VVFICKALLSGTCYLHIDVVDLTAGCFKCGKEGHISCECPEAASANSGVLANHESFILLASVTQIRNSCVF